MKPAFLSVSALCLFLSAASAGNPEGSPFFNGKDLGGWTDASGKPVTAGWTVEEGGVLHRSAKGGDIYSAKEYGDFEMSFDWKIAPGGNSGVKYRVTAYEKKGFLGPEYQLLDDAKHPDSLVGPHRQSASFYDFLAPDTAAKKLNPPGAWNTAKIVARGPKIEHWLNGAKVIDTDITGSTWKAAHAKSKFKDVPAFGQNPKGRIMLQDHGDEVWFRNLTVKEL